MDSAIAKCTPLLTFKAFKRRLLPLIMLIEFQILESVGSSGQATKTYCDIHRTLGSVIKVTFFINHNILTIIDIFTRNKIKRRCLGSIMNNVMINPLLSHRRPFLMCTHFRITRGGPSTLRQLHQSYLSSQNL